MVKARVLPNEEGEPIQLQLTAQEAADLAYIANDFARAVGSNSEDARRMVDLSVLISTRVLDCLAARAGLAIPASAFDMVPDQLILDTPKKADAA
jgi:hypothetical protein